MIFKSLEGRCQDRQCDMHVKCGDSTLSKLSWIEMGFQLDKVPNPDEKNSPEHVSTEAWVELLFAVDCTITCIILFRVYRIYSRAEFLH